MTKKLFTSVVFAAALVVLVCGCGHKSPAKKQLVIPTAVVTVDTVARLSDAIKCHVHVDFTCLKGDRYATANDSLLRMGLLQPDYFSVSYERLSPQTAITAFMRQYVKDYMEIARLVRQHEKENSQLVGELDIRTELRAAVGEYVTALSHIAVNNGNGELARYTIVRNFNPHNGHVVTLQEQFGKDCKERLTKEIVAQLADREGLDKDDIAGLKAKGYFTGIDPYPADNFILTDDSTVFIYTPGEISRREVRVAVDN